MKKGEESFQKGDFIKWFSEINKDSVPLVGGKGANLGEIFNLKVPVPPGFVVTTEAYQYFMRDLNEKVKKLLSEIDYENTDQLEEKTKEIRELIVKAKMPEDLKAEIIEAYENLNVEEKDLEKGALKVLDKREPIYVAVRSSATTEDLKDASFAGQQDSFVNVRGNEDLIENVKKCFASLYTARAAYYRHKKNYMEGALLAAVVQRMINSEKSGVIFSQNPAFKNDNITVEAVFGLGEGIVSGKITPDSYTITRKDMKIIDEFIADKKIAIIRGEKEKEETVKLPEKKSKARVLNNFEINRLAELAMRLEEHYKKPQDMEFAIEGDGIYLVQTRAITTIGLRVEKGGEIKGEILLNGTAASPGIGVGPVRVIKDLKDLDKIKGGDILVTKMTNPDMVVSMQKTVGIVTDEGGLTSHAAIVSREMGIPAVVGTENGTTKLQDGDIVTVDGSNGKVYKGKVAENQQKEIKKVEVHTKTKLKLVVDLPSFAERASRTGIREVGLTRMEGIIAESGKHPMYFVDNKNFKEYE